MTSDNPDYLRLLVNGQVGLYEKHVTDTFTDALDRLSKLQAHVLMTAAFDAGVAYGQNIGTKGFVDVMALSNRPSG